MRIVIRLFFSLTLSIPLFCGGMPCRCWAISYEKDVLAIFRAECLACHNEDEKQGDLDLSSYEAMIAGGASGTVIEIGDPEESLLYRLIAHLEQPSMPPETPMIARESIDLIKQWISEGAPKDPTDEAEDGDGGSTIPVIPIPEATRERVVHFPPRLPRTNPLATENNPAIIALAASPTSPLLAIGGVRQVWLIRTDLNERIGRLGYMGGDIRCLEFSADGSLLLVGGGRPGKEGSVEIWDIAKGVKIWTKSGYLDSVRNVAISSDHKRLAIASTGPRVDLFELPSGKLVKKITDHTDWITDLAFSDDCVLLASSDRAGGLQLWDSWTGNLYKALAGHKKPIVCLDWTFDSNYVSSSGEDGFIRIWSAETGEQKQKIKAHQGGVIQHSRLKSGGWASAGSDGILHVWSPQGKSLQAATPFHDTPTAIAYGPEYSQIFTGDYLGHVRSMDEATLVTTELPSINPPTIDEQISIQRKRLKQHTEQRASLIASIETAKSTLAQTNLDIKNAQREFQALHERTERLAKEILHSKRMLRRIQSNLNKENAVAPRSSLYVQRKLQANKQKQLIAEHAVSGELLDQARVKVNAYKENLKINESEYSEIDNELNTASQIIKRSRVQLAELLEENAFSIRYDLAFIGPASDATQLPRSNGDKTTEISPSGN